MAHQIHGKHSTSSNSLQDVHCWTDDLPICPLSGVGCATNAFYREDGLRREEHEYNDKCFHYKSDDNVFFYGIFHGHDGGRVAAIAAQRFPADLLLGQVSGQVQDSHIIELIRQAFQSVDRECLSSIDELLAEKARLQLCVAEGKSMYKTPPEHSPMFGRLQTIENELAGGATGIIALIVDSKLYIASIGCCAAVLCKRNEQNQMEYTNLTVAHDLSNPAEVQRLAHLGLNIEKLRQMNKLGRHRYTRTLGDYYVKAGYKENAILRSAVSEPVTSEPHISVCELDANCCFLLLMSEGLLQAVASSVGSGDPITDVVKAVMDELLTQSTLNGAAQAVVDGIVRRHHETFMTSTDYRKALCQRRDDVTLLIRNFTYTYSAMTRSAGSSPLLPYLSTRTAVERRSLDSMMRPLNLVIPTERTEEDIPELSGDVLQPVAGDLTAACSAPDLPTAASLADDSEDVAITDEIYSSLQSQNKRVLPLDSSGRIEAYVDFGEFYDYLSSLSEEERKLYEAEAELKSGYDSIPEEREPASATPTLTPSSNEAIFV